MHLRGFTLLELAIVIVIIALLAAAIVIANDLVRAAQLRRTLSHVQQVQTAIAGFKDKFRQLPGDFNEADSYWEGAINGNNDGRITSQSASSIFEDLNVWDHLNQAQLIAGYFVPVTATPAATDFSVVPSTAIDSQYLHLFYTTGGLTWLPNANYLAIYNYPLSFPTCTLSGALSTMNSHHGMYPADAMALDTKLDDGLPFSGNAGIQVTSPLKCTDASGDNSYSATSTKRDCGWFLRLAL